MTEIFLALLAFVTSHPVWAWIYLLTVCVTFASWAPNTIRIRTPARRQISDGKKDDPQP